MIQQPTLNKLFHSKNKTNSREEEKETELNSFLRGNSVLCGVRDGQVNNWMPELKERGN